MTWRALEHPDMPTSHLPFSPAVRAGEFVFVSGQASVDNQGNIVTGTFEQEMRRSVDNLTRILDGIHLALKDVVRVTCYVADPDDLADYNRIYPEYFPKPQPARTTLTSCLASIKFEIDAIVYAPPI